MNINKLKEPFVLLLVGPPLCGKSTWIKNNFTDKQVTVISRDQILLDIHGSNDYETAFRSVNQKEVNRKLNQAFEDASNNGDNVIVDMTNLVSKRRKTTLDYFDESYEKVAVIFPIPDKDELKKRNNKRIVEENKNISDKLMEQMIGMYQPINQHREGFDKVVSL